MANGDGKMASAFLDDRGLLRVAGQDARSFLQGLVTCNMDKVSREQAGFGALLTPQGKILFDFLIVEDEAGFLLDTDSGQIGALAKRLAMYKLRAQIAIAEEPALGILALWDGEAEPAGNALIFDDPRDTHMGRRAILDRLQAQAAAKGTRGDYDMHRIHCGIPQGGIDFQWNDIFPHDADMDRIHGLDFRKGCYVGQEVVSRMEHRGALRKRILSVQLRGAIPAPGSEILDGDMLIGALGSAAASGRALAMIRTDRAAEAVAGARPLTCAGALVDILPEPDMGAR